MSLANNDGTTWLTDTLLPKLFDSDAERTAFSVSEPEERKLQESYMPTTAKTALRQTALRTRNTTYGEVLPQSIWLHVIPALQLTNKDVFYDIGSGTGKIPLQVALQTDCALSKGVEFVESRHKLGLDALERLRGVVAGDATLPLTDARKAVLTSALERVQLIQGDACSALTPLEDATAIFINNTVFQPDLMARLVERLATLPRLRVLVTLRRICARHRDATCGRKLSPCCVFQHPIEASGEVWPTWDNATTMFVYRRAARITDYFRTSRKPIGSVGKGKPADTLGLEGKEQGSEAVPSSTTTTTAPTTSHPAKKAKK